MTLRALEPQPTHDFIGFLIVLVVVLALGYMVLEALGLFEDEETYR